MKPFIGRDWLLSDGAWVVAVNQTCPPPEGLATCTFNSTRQWKFSSEALRQGARHAPPAALSKAVANSTVVFMGDSITRHLGASFLRSVGTAGRWLGSCSQDLNCLGPEQPDRARGRVGMPCAQHALARRGLCGGDAGASADRRHSPFTALPVAPLVQLESRQCS